MAGLHATDLTIDAVLKNNNNPKHPDAEFQRYFTFHKGINNSAGFRVVAKKSVDGRSGAKAATDMAFIVLVTTFGEPEWPDTLDRETGDFVYYGDNRNPGTATNRTALNGNRYLEEVFELTHDGKRNRVPPFLLFESVKIGGRSHMRFLGLAAPGAEGLTASDDLVAVWRIKGTSRFTNYKARFTVLREQHINRDWLVDLVNGAASTESKHCPKTWKKWIATGFYDALVAVRPRHPRPKSDQLPRDPFEREILRTIFEDLDDREFEFAAAELIRFMDNKFIELEVTPRSRDGGRDVVGRYRVGHDLHQVHLAVCVEAKKWQEGSGVGVKPMARLISRLKHRDIGVFVTTSYFDSQVQEELIEDNHPVLLLSGGDIAHLLANKGIAKGPLMNWIASVRQRAAEAEAGQLKLIRPA